MDLRDLISVLRAHWLLIVASALVGALLGLGLSLLTTPTYQSRVQFYVTVSGADNAASAYQGSLGAQQRVQSYAALVKSREVAQRVVMQAGVDRTAHDVASSTTATADAKTVLLNLTVTDPLPERALKLAQGYGQVLPEVIQDLETPEGGGDALAKLTVVNSPAMPEKQVSPKTLQNVGIGLALGLLVGAGIAFLLSTLDRRVKTVQQAEEAAGAAVVGTIPFRRKEDTDETMEHVVPFRKGHSPAAEAFRRLRTNLQFLVVDNPPRVFVITSSLPEEGKSETSVNLALALAEAGNKVLLVEADLRRPRAASYIEMKENVGLSNVLAGQAAYGDVLQETPFENVSLLAGGPPPPNPSELLASKAAQSLIAELRQDFDYVVIDSPPLLPVTDGAVIAGMTDGALLVVRIRRTQTDQVKQSIDNLDKANASVLGVITVGSRADRRREAYSETYYYSPSESR